MISPMQALFGHRETEAEDHTQASTKLGVMLVSLLDLITRLGGDGGGTVSVLVPVVKQAGRFVVHKLDDLDPAEVNRYAALIAGFSDGLTDDSVTLEEYRERLARLLPEATSG